MKQYAAIDDTVYFWFAGNNTSGSGEDGASPASDVRLAGAAAGAAPVYSPTPILLSHANYPAGAYEIAITASVANGFATGNTYAVFCTLAIDSQNPTGFVGSFDTKPVESNITQIVDTEQSATDLKDMVDTGYDPSNHKIQSDLIYIHGSALTETAGQLAAAFTKLFDVATPLLVASDVMRGTNSASLAATALTNTTWTNARAGYIDNLSAGAVALDSGVDLTKIHGVTLTETIDGYLAAAFVKLFDVATPLLVASDVMRGTDDAALAATALTNITWTDAKAAFIDASIAAIPTTAMRGTDNAALAATALSNAEWTDAKAAFLDHSIATVDGNVDTLLTRITAAVALASVLDTVKAKTDNLPSGIAKNVALSDVGAYMVLSSDHVTAATGKTVTGQISKDGAAFGATTNAVSEVGSGMYKIDLTQAEMNADVIHLKFTETDCDQRIIPVYTT